MKTFVQWMEEVAAPPAPGVQNAQPKVAPPVRNARPQAAPQQTSNTNQKPQAGQKVIVYPNMQGVDNADNVNAGEQKMLKVGDCIGNEPGKDFNYFKNGSDPEKGPMNEYVGGIVKAVREKGPNAMPPVKSMRHPLLPGKYLVIDGNHRLGAFKVAGFPEIKAIVLGENDIVLAAPGTKWQQGATPQTMTMADAMKNKVDLKSYFNTRELAVPANDEWVASLRTANAQG